MGQNLNLPVPLFPVGRFPYRLCDFSGLHINAELFDAERLYRGIRDHGCIDIWCDDIADRNPVILKLDIEGFGHGADRIRGARDSC